MMNTKRGCLTCKWADYLKTPTGKLKKHSGVRCNFQPPTQEHMQALIAPLLSAAHLQYFTVRADMNSYVWPRDGIDGSDCTKWEPKE